MLDDFCSVTEFYLRPSIIPLLVDGLAGSAAPTKSVGRALESDHPDPVVSRITPRVTSNDDRVSDLQCIASDALALQQAGAAPLDHPLLHDAILIWSFNVHKRM